MSVRSSSFAGLGISVVLLCACVTRERNEVVAAREAHARCIANHSPSHAECQALEERLRQAQERYERDARAAWGCDASEQECPIPR